MKKILASLLLIILLWLGATAVIGSKTKSEIENRIEKINNLYIQYGIQLNIVEYQKSFFNSTATIEITAIDKELENFISQTYGVVFPIISKSQIEHGPIFFKNGLEVGLSKIHKEFEINTIFNQKIKDKFVKNSMITSNILVSFFKVANVEIKSDAIDIEDGAKKIHIEPLNIVGDSDIETLAGEMQMNLPLISFVENDKKMKIESIVLNAKIYELVKKSLGMGELNLAIERFYVSDKKSGELDIQPTIRLISKKDGEKTFSSEIDMEIDFRKNTIEKSISEFEKLALNIKLNGIGIDGMEKYDKIAKEIEQKQAIVMIDIQKNPENQEANYAKLIKLQEDMLTGLLDSLKDMLFKDKTSINYGFNVQTKDKKESHGDILLGYTGDIDFNQTVAQISQKISANVFKLFKLEVDISVDKNHIKSLPNGEELIKQLQTPMAQNMIADKNDSYTIKGHLANQELILNDNNLTNTILPLLKMFTQMGMAQ